MEVGEKVVIYLDSPSMNGPYKIGTVERVTQTFVVVDGKKYNIKWPHKTWGTGDLWHYDSLVPEKSIEEAEQANEEWRIEYQVKVMRNALRRVNWGNVPDGDIVTIYKTMKQMGLFKEER